MSLPIKDRSRDKVKRKVDILTTWLAEPKSMESRNKEAGTLK